MARLLPLLLLLAAACSAPEPELPVQPAGLPADVAPTQWDVRPLLPGMKAPELSLTKADGGTWTLNPDGMDAPVVLVFYRGGWCPFCNRQLSELREADRELEELGFEIVFASADRPEALEPSLRDTSLVYTLVSDNDLVAARAFGIAYEVDDATVQRYEGTAMDLDEASGRDHHWLPAPAVWIISTDGTIQFGYVNPNYRVRVSPSVVMAAAREVAAWEAEERGG